ncbi:unnamed protein product [Oppiella nova]|uniref:Uncharacterized protein n=1 Tax=Oppiella nova TaxID=334625 RepID=A0A7R9LCE4_9ACAR|nr:unnamed protein product [Oppiella nova]CAG2162109.1 unnamed protein product [Oppiella nova]
MSREWVEEDNSRSISYDRKDELKLKQSISESESISGEEHTNRPKIMITSPSAHRLIRSQAIHYYHPYHPNHRQHNQYSNIEEDSWESCVDVPSRTAFPTTSSDTTAAAIHSMPESVSRASSHTTSQSNQSNPYNR